MINEIEDITIEKQLDTIKLSLKRPISLTARLAREKDLDNERRAELVKLLNELNSVKRRLSKLTD